MLTHNINNNTVSKSSYADFVSVHVPTWAVTMETAHQNEPILADAIVRAVILDNQLRLMNQIDEFNSAMV